MNTLLDLSLREVVVLLLLWSCLSLLLGLLVAAVMYGDDE